MSKFKVGDKIKKKSGRCFSNGRYELTIDSITNSVFTGKGLVYIKETDSWLSAGNIELVEPSLECQLLEQKCLRDKAMDECSLIEERIRQLKRAIEERDKPKGRVGIKDVVKRDGGYYLVCANGEIRLHIPNGWTKGHISMGNLYYDRESAEKYVHDRKQEILRDTSGA